MAKKKYYAVKNGRETGIFETWEDCEKQVKGFKNAVYEGFSTLNEAFSYLGIEQYEKENSENLPPDGTLFAYVDGSYNAKEDIYGYGIVLIFSDGATKELNGSGKNADVSSMRNVAGELKGAFLSMQYAVNNGYKALTVFHDYEGIAKWAQQKWKANLKETMAYRDFCQSISKIINLSFVKVDAHTGVKYNELADALAKKAAGIGE